MFVIVPRLPILIATLAACAGAPVTPSEGESSRTVEMDGAVVVITFDPIDAETSVAVEKAVRTAIPVLRRWGGLEQPVAVRIHPTHDALEAAVRRFNYAWLRAWARYDTVDLQSPRTWTMGEAPIEAVTELLTHELTHCAMYQRSGTASDWMFKGIPLWFREGMASVTALQGYRRFTDEEVWMWLRSHPGVDPVADADQLYQSQERLVYGAAHRSFAFLARRYGDASVNALLTYMKAGLGFDVAFRRAIGLDERAFAAEYVRYVRWEGWRDMPKEPPPVLVPFVGPTVSPASTR